MHKLLKQTMAIVLGAALCLAGAGCGGEKETISGGWNDIVINEGKPVTLLVDLNGLLPTTNTEPTEQQPIVFRSIQDITDEFCEMFPNVTVQWAYNKKSVGDWAQWMTTQIGSN